MTDKFPVQTRIRWDFATAAACGGRRTEPWCDFSGKGGDDRAAPSVATQDTGRTQPRRQCKNAASTRAHPVAGGGAALAAGIPRSSVRPAGRPPCEPSARALGRAGVIARHGENRMAVLRWWCQKIGRGHVMAKTNDAYGIARRQYVTNVSKGIQLAEASLAKIDCPYVRWSLILQRDFGLRKEESMLF